MFQLIASISPVLADDATVTIPAFCAGLAKDIALIVAPFGILGFLIGVGMTAIGHHSGAQTMKVSFFATVISAFTIPLATMIQGLIGAGTLGIH